MCGICGIIDLKGRTIDRQLIQNMSDAMVHRGPDGEGSYINSWSRPSVGLGHRRLKIIDLSDNGRQPMANENNDIQLVLNGEIYNYKELRQNLRQKGHIFKSNTDSEVVIHLYEEYGQDCLVHLRGMFAFVIWDEKKKILFMARDRAGQKPLLYYFDGEVFCFASEFNSILASRLIDRQINPESISCYLTFGYIPSPLTIYKNVFKLPPAHFLLLKDEKVAINQYWQLDYSQKIVISEKDAADEISRLLVEAVKLRMHSDVPLGVFLSGGIDSSIITGLMNQISKSKVKTFSIGFKEQDFNELKYARCIAERFDTEHNEFIVEPKAVDILPLLIERYGEPYADSSCIPTYYVSQQTRRYVTVALNGDAGDENFAGYERYQAMLLSQGMPALLKKAISSFATLLPDSIEPKNRLRRLKRFFAAASLPAPECYLRWVSVFSDQLKESIYSKDFLNKVAKRYPVEWIKSYMDDSNKIDLVDKLLMTDVNTYLPNDLLVKVDITSMANSLEARSPFLDHKLMEFVASLPAEYKMKNLKKKYILKKVARHLIPPKNIHRKKMGFGVPVGKWFRNELKDFLCDTILSGSSLSRGYFKHGAIKNIVKKHVTGQMDYSLQLWSLLILELWHKRFID